MSKSNRLIDESPFKTSDYHPEVAIHDLAFNIKDAMEDIQMLAEDIARIVEPLIHLDPKSDVDDEDFDDEDEDEEDLDLDEFDDEDEDDEFDDEDDEEED